MWQAEASPVRAVESDTCLVLDEFERKTWDCRRDHRVEDLESLSTISVQFRRLGSVAMANRPAV